MSIMDLIKTPIKDINMSLVAFFTERHLANNPHNTPGQTAVAVAALALQEAYVKVDYQSAPADTFVWTTSDVNEIAEARANLVAASISGSVTWGVPRRNLPKEAQLGEIVKIQYRSNGIATIVGYVHDALLFTEGRGLIIKLLETNNSLNLRPGGWRYIGLWMPHYPTTQGGFVTKPKST